MRWLAWSLVAILGLLAGCGHPPCSRVMPVTAHGLALDLPALGGEGPATLVVTVTEGPGGPAVEGVALALYWAGDGPDALEGQPLEEVGADGQVRQDGQKAATPHPSHVLSLRTDADGRAKAQVPERRQVGIAATKQGYTHELMPHVLATGVREVAIPLYRTNVTAWANGTLSPGGASAPAMAPSWSPQLVHFGANPGADAGYQARLVEIEARLSWTNAPLASADLGVGLGDGNTLVAWSDDGYELLPGPNEESVAVRAARENGWQEARLAAGPTTTTAYAAPLGLAYSLEVAGSVASPRTSCIYVGPAEGEPAPTRQAGSAGAVEGERGRDDRVEDEGPALEPMPNAGALAGAALAVVAIVTAIVVLATWGPRRAKP